MKCRLYLHELALMYALKSPLVYSCYDYICLPYDINITQEHYHLGFSEYTIWLSASSLPFLA